MTRFNYQRSNSLLNQKSEGHIKKKGSIDIQQNNLFEIQEKEENDIENNRVLKIENEDFNESVSQSSKENDNVYEIIYDQQNHVSQKSQAKNHQSLSIESISDN